MQQEERPDQTRPDQTHTHQTPGTELAPQIKMRPGHSICMPLPSSQRDFTVCQKTSPKKTQLSSLKSISKQKKKGKKDQSKPFLQELHLLKQNPPSFNRQKCFGLHTVGEAGERKEHQPALTPTKESKAGPASTPVSPWVPSQKGLVVILHKEKQIVEKNINKKGKCPNPLLSFTTIVSQTFFIIIRFISIHILNKKHADCFVCFLLSFCLFLKKRQN